MKQCKNPPDNLLEIVDEAIEKHKKATSKGGLPGEGKPGDVSAIHQADGITV